MFRFLQRAAQSALVRHESVSYLFLLFAYVVCGKLGLMLALPPGYASPIFPPAGIAVAAVLIGGRRTLPWILLGSFLLNVWVGYSASQQIGSIGLAVAAVIAIASMLQAAIGGAVLRKLIGYPVALDHAGDVIRFLLLAPLICFTSASISVSGLWALGIIETASFGTSWAAWWVGDTLGVVVMLPLVMIVAGEPRTLWKSRKLTVAVPMLLVFALFIMIFLKANQWENNDSLMDFRHLSQQAVNQVQNRLGEQETVLDEISSLFIHDANGLVTRKEFHRFVGKSLNRFPMIQALEWAPFVDAAHRASFEAAQRKDIPGFEIRARDAAGQMQRADEHSSFYPVTYIEPLAGNEPAMGFDLSSNPERQAALAEAIRKGTAITTPPVNLVQERIQQDGVLLLSAIKQHDTKSGVVLIVLRMGDFMDKLLSDTRPMLYTRLIDLDGQKTIYDNFAPDTTGALYEQAFDFGTRHYLMETAPTPAYLMQHHGWQSWSVLAAGILGTGLLGALFLLGTGYTARIKAQVGERTRELNENKKRLQEAQRIAQVGSWELDIARNILTWSDEIYNIFEIDRASFGASYEAFINAIHPEDRVLVDSAYSESVKHHRPYSIEHRLLLPDGRIKTVLEKCETFYDAEGRALRSIGTVQDITERKQAESAIHASESRYRALVENSPFCIHEIDLEGRLTSMNKAGLEMLALDDEKEVCGIPYLNSVSEQDFGRIKSLMREAFNGITSHFEFSAAGHTPLYFKSCFVPIKNARGKVMYLMGLTENITERKKAEQKIKDNEALWGFALEGAGDCVWDWNLQTGKVSLSKSGASMFGYKQGEISDDIADWYARLLPEDQLRWNESLRQFFHEKADRLSLEYRVRCEDGSYIWILTRGMVVSHSADGKVSRMIGVHSDISQRKQSETLLRKSAEENEDLYNNAPCGYHSLDKDGVIVRINNTELEWLGYAREEVVGILKITDLVTPEGKLVFQKNFPLVKKQGFINELEIEMVRKDGSILYGLVNVTVIFDADGEFLTSRSTMFDITERKRVEKALYESHQQIHMLLNSMAEGAYGVDVDGNCTFVNRSFLQILGYENADEIIGKHIHELIHHSRPDGSHYPATECKMYNAYRHNQSIHTSDEVYWHKDGHAVSVEYWSQPIVHNDVMSGAIATFIDITERKRVMAELRESEERFRQMFENHSAVMLLIDPQSGQIVDANPAAAEFYGYPLRFLRGKLVSSINTLPQAEIARQMEEAAKERRNYFEFKHRLSNNEIRDIEVHSSTVNFKGKPLLFSIIHDITARKRAEEQIHHLAYYDTLTDLPNRRLLMDRLNQTLSQAGRYKRSFAVMFLDLDHFKEINDKLGHDVGDELLKEVAVRLNACVRSSDTLSRQGGDEFVIILTELAGPENAALVAEKILTSLNEPILIGNHQLLISTSIGISVYSPESPEDAQTLMKKADMSMYAAKESGRNQYRFCHCPTGYSGTKCCPDSETNPH